MFLLTAGHIGVWVRACEESEDEGEVSHLLIIIIIVTIIIIIIIIIIDIIILVTWSTVGTMSQKSSTSQHCVVRAWSSDTAIMELTQIRSLPTLTEAMIMIKLYSSIQCSIYLDFFLIPFPIVPKTFLCFH